MVQREDGGEEGVKKNLDGSGPIDPGFKNVVLVCRFSAWFLCSRGKMANQARQEGERETTGGRQGEGWLQLRIEPKACLRTCVCLRVCVCVSGR